MSQILRALSQARRSGNRTAARDDGAVLAGLGVRSGRQTKPAVGRPVIWVLAAVLVLAGGGWFAVNILRKSAPAVESTPIAEVAAQDRQQPAQVTAPVVPAGDDAEAEATAPSTPEPPAASERTPIATPPASDPMSAAPQRSVDVDTRPAAPIPPPAAVQPPPPPTEAPATVDHFKLAVYYQQAGDFDNALIHYRALLQREPLNAEAHNNLGLLYRTKRMHDEAIREFHLALNVDPKYRVARNNLGATLLETGRPEAAAAELAIIVADEPDSPDALVNLALAQSALKQGGTAQETLMRAIGIEPRHAAAHYNLARLYEQEGEPGKALDHYRKFLQYAGAQHASVVPEVRSRVAALEKKSAG